MPLSRAPRAPDLERVVRVLGGRVVEGAGRDPSPGGWVPSRPGGVADLQLLGLGPGESPSAAGSRAATGGHGDGWGEGELPASGSPGDLESDLRRARRPGLVTLPASLRSGRVAVSSTAVVSVLALVVALGCAFVVRILWAERSLGGAVTGSAVVGTDGPTRGRGSAGAVPEVVSRSPGASAATGAPGGPGSGEATTEVVVHVVGEVRRPGVVRLRLGARVADAIKAAGGAKEGAELASLNLARVVADGEQIVVPKPGETVSGPGVVGGAAPGTGAGAGAGAASPGGASGLVNLNTADLASLDTLPGVGPVLAQRILDWRTEHGRFTSVEELGEVSGIGDKLMAQLRPKVTV